MTTGVAEEYEEGLTSWHLYEKQSGNVILQGDQLKVDQIDEHVAKCLRESNYVFSISNREGNGFGDCDTCGYFIFVDDVAIGGSVSFFDNEKLTFALPDDGFCSGDFFLSLNTGIYPNDVT